MFSTRSDNLAFNSPKFDIVEDEQDEQIDFNYGFSVGIINAITNDLC